MEGTGNQPLATNPMSSVYRLDPCRSLTYSCHGNWNGNKQAQYDRQSFCNITLLRQYKIILSHFAAAAAASANDIVMVMQTIETTCSIFRLKLENKNSHA